MERTMNNISKIPFSSIESSHEYLTLLAETVEENLMDVEAEINLAIAENAKRRKEALQLVSYKLTKLYTHIKASRHILNDLRTLRCLLHGERVAADRNTSND
jgi:hypothetical protein